MSSLKKKNPYRRLSDETMSVSNEPHLLSPALGPHDLNLQIPPKKRLKILQSSSTDSPQESSASEEDTLLAKLLRVQRKIAKAKEQQLELQVQVRDLKEYKVKLGAAKRENEQLRRSIGLDTVQLGPLQQEMNQFMNKVREILES